MSLGGPRKMMGFDVPGDQKVAIRVRDWGALKLALWRSRAGWEIVAREAIEVLRRCLHAPECPGATDDSKPCLDDCADREYRMSALVILNATKMLAPFDARQPAKEPYMAPGRELYSEVIAELAIAQAKLDAYEAAGMHVTPDPNENPTLPPPPRELTYETYIDELALDESAPLEPELEATAEEPPQ